MYVSTKQKQSYRENRLVAASGVGRIGSLGLAEAIYCT